MTKYLKFSEGWINKVFFSIIIFLLFITTGKSQIPPVGNPQIMCEATLESWSNDLSMREYMATHDCDCSNGPNSAPVCTEINSENDSNDPGNGNQEDVNNESLLQQNQLEQQKRLEEQQLQNQIARQKRLEEQQRKEKEFLEGKNELTQKLKGTANNDLNLKTGTQTNTGLPLKTGTQTNTGLPLKTGAAPSNSLMKVETEKDLQVVRERISKMEMDVKIMQNQLKMFSKDLFNNNSEFEVWAEMVDRSAKSALENGKQFAVDLFLNYGLGNILEKSVKQGIFAKFDELINSTDPEMRAFLAKEIKSRSLEFKDLKTVSDHMKVSGDLAELYSSDEETWKKTLDALLLVNDLFEAYKLSSLELQASPVGQFFGQAKITGQALADFSAVAYGWFSINRLEKENEQYAKEVESVSMRMESSVKQIACLKQCLEVYSKDCMDKCSGKTRFSTPPPPLK